MKNRSVSVTGATGFLGWHAAEAFLARGWHVRAIVRPGNTKPLPDGVESRESALHAAALTVAVAGTDVLVHSAALMRSGNDDVLRAANVDATRAVIDAANSTGSRLVLMSSQAAIGAGTLARPAREDDAPHPLTAYGRSKLAAEMFVRADARVPWTILRPCSVYGPRDRQFLPLIRLAARGWFPIAAPPSTPFTLIYVEDVARAIVMASEDERAIGEALFIAHPEPHTSSSILQHIATAVGRPYKPRQVPRFALRALALGGEVAWRFGFTPMLDRARLSELEAEGFVCAVDRAERVMGFRATMPLTEGLERTVRWYRDRGWL